MSEMLVHAHTPADCDLSLDVQADPVVLDIDRAVTLGLIANELVLNALKHAFAGRSSGALVVTLRDGATIELGVRDNGSGLPPDFDPKKTTSLGVELVAGLSRQLRGEARIENAPSGGVNAVVRFSVEERTGRASAPPAFS
jgi:two-component sensor histidine kinase